MVLNGYILHPSIMMTCNFILFFIAAAVGAVAFGSLNLREAGRRDYLIWDHKAVLDDDQFHLMNEIIDIDHKEQRKLENGGFDGVPIRTEVMHTIQLVYRMKNITDGEPEDQSSEDGEPHKQGHGGRRRLHIEEMYEDLDRWGLFEKASLKFMQTVEDEIREMASFKKLCLAKSETNTECSKLSIISPVDILKDENRALNIRSLSQGQIVDKLDDFFQDTKNKSSPWMKYQPLLTPGLYEQ